MKRKRKFRQRKVNTMPQRVVMNVSSICESDGGRFSLMGHRDGIGRRGPWGRQMYYVRISEAVYRDMHEKLEKARAFQAIVGRHTYVQQGLKLLRPSGDVAVVLSGTFAKAEFFDIGNWNMVGDKPSDCEVAVLTRGFEGTPRTSRIGLLEALDYKLFGADARVRLGVKGPYKKPVLAKLHRG